MRRALEHFQVQRLRHDFADLIGEPQYAGLKEFFFGELYAPRDFSERNASAHRLYEILRAVPGVRLASIEHAIRLMELTEALDAQLAALLLTSGAGAGFGTSAYEAAYRQADAYDLRLEQIDLLVKVVRDVHSLAQLPLTAWHMRRSVPMARMLGFGPLAGFLANSLEAVGPVRDIERFLAVLDTREKQRLNRIYG